VEGVDVDDADGMASGVSLSLSLSLSLVPFSFLTIELERFLGDADGDDLMETIDEERSRPFSFSFSGKRLAFLSSGRISWLPDPSAIGEEKEINCESFEDLILSVERIREGSIENSHLDLSQL
jgi:hypothetical protein